MRKIILLCLAIVMLAMTACTEKNGTTQKSAEEKVKYSTFSTDRQMWSSAEEMIEDEATTYIVAGTVRDISFQVENSRIGMTREEEEERIREGYSPDSIYDLDTVYDIDVIETLKGKPNSAMKIRTMGGIKDDYVDEQYAALREYDMEYIPIYEGGAYPTIKIGETYLFALHQYEDRIPYVMGPIQGAYSLRDPFAKNRIHPWNGVGKEPVRYESESSSEFSAYDVISTFGEEKWGAFWTQWQRDNPDWETRMDKAAVERVLAG